MTKPLENKRIYAKNEASRDDAPTSFPALEHSQPIKEAEHMSRCGYNGDSTPKIKIQEEGTFTPIGILADADVERLRAKRDAAWDEHLWEIAETYHEMMTDAEIGDA